MIDHPPRIVKPRARSYRRLPVVAIWRGVTVDENGETDTTDNLTRKLPYMNPTLFAMLGAADFLGTLNGQYLLKYPSSWQWRAATHERDICRPDGLRVAARVSTVIHYFGWKGGNYHKIIDPVSMYGHDLNTLWPENIDPHVKLLKWAQAIRDFCDENGLEVRPTTGGLASQFLTDKRFYPKPRRKVPAFINDATREHLPGNHYLLNVTPSPHKDFTAYYLDQHRAHHYHARTTAFPDADTLYAHGRFLDLKEVSFDTVPSKFYGLLCLDLQAPEDRPAFHWHHHKQKVDKVYVFTSELQHLLDSGYVVNGVRACWGSRHRDTGITKYAMWCESQLDRYGDPRWLKQLLLSTYGVLATNPKYADSVFRLARSGAPVEMRTGHRRLNGRQVVAIRKLEPRIANVLHRGMIEAATRSESVGLAQWLNHTGQRVLSIYADAVIVQADDDKPLPVLPEPWRLKKTLNHLQFINQQAFISDSMTKLPGVSRELMRYRQHCKPGHAPRVLGTEALTGRTVQTDRRI